MSRMSLADFPTELLVQICKFSGVEEIKNLRLTSRSLLYVANEHVFRELTIFYTLRSIGTASVMVTKRPELAKSIKTLRFEAERLPDLLDFETWNVHRETLKLDMNDMLMRQAKPSIPFGLYSRSTLNSHADSLRRGYQLYRRLQAQQNYLDREGSRSPLRNMLKPLLGACPGLTSIHFVARRAAANKHSTINARVHALTEMLRAANDTQCRITELVVIDISSCFFAQSAPALNEVCNIAAALEVFRWRFAPRRSYEYFHSFSREAQQYFESFQAFFKAFVMRAENLKVLDLDTLDADDGPDRMIGGCLSCPEFSFSRLSELRLTGVIIREAALSGLLLRHAGTLTSISFIKVRLNCGSTWDMCLQRVAGKLKQLETAHLEYLEADGSASVVSWESESETEDMVKHLRNGGIATGVLKGGVMI